MQLKSVTWADKCYKDSNQNIGDMNASKTFSIHLKKGNQTCDET